MCAYPYEWFKAAYYDSRLFSAFPWLSAAFRPGLSASIPANYGSRKELGMTIRREEGRQALTTDTGERLAVLSI